MKKSISATTLILAALILGCGGSSVKAPIVPSGVTAAATTGQVNLAWNAAALATSYNIYYSTSSGVTPSNGTKISGITATSYQHTGLTNGTTYHYIVTALRRAAESKVSAEVAATPLDKPAGIAATAGVGQVVLAWNPVPGAASYNVYFSTTTGVTPSTGTKVSGIVGATYTHTSLVNGTTYHYVVTAVAANSESLASAEATGTPSSSSTVPASPANLSGIPLDGQVALTWAAVDGALDYNVYYGTAPGVTTASSNHVLHVTGNSYSPGELVNGTLYYFVVTAANDAGESAVSSEIGVTPTNGITVALAPGTAKAATLQVNPSLALTFSFDAAAVSENAIATITPIAQSDLPLPLARSAMFNRALVPAITTNGTYIVGFRVGLNPPTIPSFNVPVTVGGNLGNLISENATINLAFLYNNLWADEATFRVAAQGAFSQNIPSVTLPGLLNPGWHLLYRAAEGGNTSVSNLGVVLLADDGSEMADNSNGLQVVHLYDANGQLLTSPVVNLLDYPNAGDLDGAALTPDGSQGIMVDGGNTVRFFSNVQTGTPVASANTLDVSNWGGDGDSIAILPNGDEAVVSLDADNSLLVVSGILSGTPVAASTIPVPNYRDGLVMSRDGNVLLARGYGGLAVFSVAHVAPPVAGSIAGTVSHQYTQIADLTSLGTEYTEDGRDGMAISPADSSRAIVVTPDDGSVRLITGLPASPTVGAPVSLGSASPLSVAITPDGKLAIVGTQMGLAMFSGVDTGNLVQVGSLFTPTYSINSNPPRTLSLVPTLGITLDGKYAVVGDSPNWYGHDGALVVIPFNASGFAPPAEAIPLTISDNDQLLVH
jgi:fibronectin type 3 domain-containing protein